MSATLTAACRSVAAVASTLCLFFEQSFAAFRRCRELGYFEVLGLK
jgi:hypothetical protein